MIALSSPVGEFACRTLRCLVVLAVCIACPVRAEEAAARRAEPGAELLRDLTPLLLDTESYTEGWDYYFRFDDGTWVTVQLFVSNFGPGDHHGLLIAKILRPDGKVLVLKNGRSRSEWRFNASPLELEFGRHRFSGQHPAYRIDLINSSGELELDFTVHQDPWRMPIAGIEPAVYQYTSIMVPRLTVSGRYRPRDKTRSEPFPWQTLGQGQGFAVRYVNSGTLTTVAREWLRFVPLDGASTPLVTTITQGGRRTSAFAAVPHQGNTELQALSIASPLLDPKPSDKNIPGPIEVAGSENGVEISGKITPRRLLDRFDFLTELKKIERLFLRLMSTPVQYRYLADYEFVYRRDREEKKLTGVGIVELMVLD